MQCIADVEDLIMRALREQMPESYTVKLLISEADDNPLKITEREILIPFLKR